MGEIESIDLSKLNISLDSIYSVCSEIDSVCSVHDSSEMNSNLNSQCKTIEPQDDIDKLNISLDSIDLDPQTLRDITATSIIPTHTPISKGTTARVNLVLKIETDKNVSYFIDSLLIKQQTNALVHHHLKFNGSYQSMEQMAHLINNTPNASIKIPCSRYKIKKSIPAAFSIEIYIKCNRCGNYSGSLKSNTQCPHPSCNGAKLKTTVSDYFLYIPIKEQIEKNVKSNIDEILAYNSSVISSSKIIDIHNTETFKKVGEKYPSFILLPIIINTDGAKVYNSCSNSLWLIQAYQGYIPPNKRFRPSNIMIIAATIGKSKPNMPDFFYLF